MLATPVDRAFSDPDWLFELKLDGYRIQAVVVDGACRLWTRNRKDAATLLPRVRGRAPDWIGIHDAIVDGEVVALDGDGRPNFSLLQDSGRHEGSRRQAGRACGQ